MFILLVCNAGMSTSILVSKMRKASEKLGKNYEILATAVDSAYEYYDKADVILIGPQIGAFEKQIKEEFKKPVAVVDRKAYGTMDGEKVLQQAEELLGKS
ncbi:PTS sugar transporter subunit IIB [Erysipelotrichaceae bacterium HCN-30851]